MTTLHDVIARRPPLADEAIPSFKKRGNVISTLDGWDCFVANIAPRNDGDAGSARL